MTATMQVTAEELAYVDQAAGSDKFYRVFRFGSTVAVQYGRAGTFGTFKRTEFDDETAAEKAAAKQADSKFKKGYERIKATVLHFDGMPSDSHLDAAMAGIAAGTAAVDAGARQADAHAAAVVKLNDVAPVAVDPDVLDRVLAALAALRPGVTPAVGATSSVVRPMLAEVVPADGVAALLGDDAWWAQPKLDGERFVIEVVDGTVAVWNRQGQPKVANVAEALLTRFRQLAAGRWVFDGEVVGRKLHLFDMVDAAGVIDAMSPFRERHAALAVVLDALEVDDSAVCLVDCATTTQDKTTLLARVTDEQREGVIFRLAEAGYQAGRRASVLLKHKLLKEADCVVVDVGVGGKENASVAVFDDNGDEVVVGSVSTIGKGPVKIGDVVEVQFLYVVDPAFPRMFQPRIVRVRTDKAAHECLMGQFANAGTNKAG